MIAHTSIGPDHPEQAIRLNSRAGALKSRVIAYISGALRRVHIHQRFVCTFFEADPVVFVVHVLLHSASSTGLNRSLNDRSAWERKGSGIEHPHCFIPLKNRMEMFESGVECSRDCHGVGDFSVGFLSSIWRPSFSPLTLCNCPLFLRAITLRPSRRTSARWQSKRTRKVLTTRASLPASTVCGGIAGGNGGD